MTTQAVVNGNLTYNIHTSQTGAFAGEETTTTIFSGNLNEVSGNLDAFYGRYVVVQANVASTGGLSSIQELQFTTQNVSYTVTLDDLDTTQLTANSTGVIVPLGRTVGAVRNIQATARKTTTGGGIQYVATGYIAATYFDDTTGSDIVVPSIISKNRHAPTLQFTTTDNVTTDVVFDAIITVLPEQARLNDNLIVR
jgi:hypothetical protein